VPANRRAELICVPVLSCSPPCFEAGLVQRLPRGHKSTGKGRNQARETSEISFHSLRHSAVTMLKAAGVSDFIAREIVGHESAAVSHQYTHLTTDDKRTAMQRLPDVTDGQDALKRVTRHAGIL